MKLPKGLAIWALAALCTPEATVWLTASASATPCPSRASLLVAVKLFANQLLVQKNPAEAYADFASPDLLQRNGPFGRTRASTIAQWQTMTERASSSFRILSIRLHGDVAHIRFLGSLGPGQVAKVDQYDRLRCGKIVEEWAEFKVLQNRPAAAE